MISVKPRVHVAERFAEEVAQKFPDLEVSGDLEKVILAEKQEDYVCSYKPVTDA